MCTSVVPVLSNDSYGFLHHWYGGSNKDTVSTIAPITGYMLVSIGSVDGGSSRQSTVKLNGTTVATAESANSNDKAPAQALVPVNVNDIITIELSSSCTDGWKTAGHYVSIGYFTV